MTTMEERQLAGRDQLTRLAILFDEHGIDRARRLDRLRLCSNHAGRLLSSSAELSWGEADVLIRRLQSLPKGALPRVVAQLVAEEEAAAAALANREPDPEPEAPVEEPAPEPVVQVADVVEPLPPIGAFRLTPDGPIPVDVVVEPEEPWTGPVMVNGERNPTGTGRYCLPPPGTCYCGSCPHYAPIDPGEYERAARTARAGLVERDRKKAERRRNR